MSSLRSRRSVNPDAVAVICEDRELSYRELNDRSNQLAHCVREFGIGPETLVAICLERSPELLVGLLGVLKAGGAYVPIDPNYPQERLAFVLEDTRARVLLTTPSLHARLQGTGAKVVYVDSDADAGERSAIIYSIIEGCRHHDVEPYTYLRDVLTRRPTMTNRQTKRHCSKSLGSSHQKHCTESSVNIVNVVTQTNDVYSSFQSIDYCKALGVTLTITSVRKGQEPNS